MIVFLKLLLNYKAAGTDFFGGYYLFNCSR